MANFLTDLDAVSIRAKSHRLLFNAKKSVHLQFSLKIHQKLTTACDLHDLVVPWAVSTKFLGVLIDSKLTRKMHHELLAGRMQHRLRYLNTLLKWRDTYVVMAWSGRASTGLSGHCTT